MTDPDTHRIQSRRHGVRIFHRVGNLSYQRADGTDGSLTVWRTACVKCGAPFHITAPATEGSGNSFFVVHCLDHRQRTKRTSPASIARQSALDAAFASHLGDIR